MSALSISDLPETVIEGPEEVVEAETLTLRIIARRAARRLGWSSA